MLCFSNLKKSLLLSLLFLFSVLSFSLVSNVADSYAVSDIVFTYDSSVSANLPAIICDTDCSSYNYVFTTCPSSPYYSSYFVVNLVLALNNSQSSANYRIYPNFNDLLTIPSGYSLHSISLSSQSQVDKSLGCTITLSENNPLISDSEPEEPCPVCPQIPENPYDEKLDSIRRSILLVGSIPLVLYFFYSIYRMIIKSTGGS